MKWIKTIGDRKESKVDLDVNWSSQTLFEIESRRTEVDTIIINRDDKNTSFGADFYLREMCREYVSLILDTQLDKSHLGFIGDLSLEEKLPFRTLIFKQKAVRDSMNGISARLISTAASKDNLSSEIIQDATEFVISLAVPIGMKEKFLERKEFFAGLESTLLSK